MDVYYCGKGCQQAWWPRHKLTHAIGELLRAIEHAPNNEQREQKLRQLLNTAKENKLWIEENLSKEGVDSTFITHVQLEMLRVIHEDPLQKPEVKRMALDALAALLPFSKFTFNIMMAQDFQKIGSFPSLLSAQWLYGGEIFHVDALALKRGTREFNVSTDTGPLLVWPLHNLPGMNDKVHGFCRFKTANGSSFEGAWRNGKLHGQAIANYADGQMYKGQWMHGTRSGWGMHRASDGSTFEGDFRNGEPNGKGKHINNATGLVYEGSWRNGKQNGQGTLVLADGARLECEWLNGQPHGEGSYTSDDGSYVGGFYDGRKHGKGKLIFANGTFYEGDWRNGLQHGKGQQKYFDGQFYDGEWLDGMRHGQGTLTYPESGSMYEGAWRNGKKHGRAKFTYVAFNGILTEVDAEWLDDKPPSTFDLSDVSFLFK